MQYSITEALWRAIRSDQFNFFTEDYLKNEISPMLDYEARFLLKVTPHHSPKKWERYSMTIQILSHG